MPSVLSRLGHGPVHGPTDRHRLRPGRPAERALSVGVDNQVLLAGGDGVVHAHPAARVADTHGNLDPIGQARTLPTSKRAGDGLPHQGVELQILAGIRADGDRAAMTPSIRSVILHLASMGCVPLARHRDFPLSLFRCVEDLASASPYRRSGPPLPQQQEPSLLIGSSWPIGDASQSVAGSRGISPMPCEWSAPLSRATIAVGRARRVYPPSSIRWSLGSNRGGPPCTGSPPLSAFRPGVRHRRTVADARRLSRSPSRRRRGRARRRRPPSPSPGGR